MAKLSWREHGNAGTNIAERRAFETIGKILQKFDELVEEMIEKIRER